MTEEKKPGRSADISFRISLDEKNVPEKITWHATDSASQIPEETSAIMLSIWDAKQKESLRIDLWTKAMTQEEMDKFYFQTFSMMAESYDRSNKNPQRATLIRDFAKKFGVSAEVIKEK